ncbi:hypothetical protein [Nonomuraea glycinis]|uniref:Mom family adenine methylcarbamoylation protein n=1 Tax=Nonomuraea glycinis TaxID=2047744 RepID=UPI0033A54885
MQQLELAPASDWCQRWLPGRRHTWRHRSQGGFNPDQYGVAPLKETDAKQYVTTRHYSGTYPAASLRYGLYDLTTGQQQLVGAAVLSIPATAATLTNVFPDLEPYAESFELGRFVLDDPVPANGETWFLAEVLRLAGHEGVRGVVSFADPIPRTTLDGDTVFLGHRGTIYQAANAEYLGRATPRTLTLLPDATVLSPRALSKIRNQERGRRYAERLLIAHGAPPRRIGQSSADWLAEALRAARVRRLRHPGNYRYAFRAGPPAARRRVHIPLKPLPYPKDQRTAA